MSKRTKNIIISLTTIFVLVGIILTLSFTVFSLKSVEINYKTTHNQILLSDEEIVESGDFAYGKSVFFHSKAEYIKNIEKFNPYIDVINIETVFPSKFVVHIAQRQEVYAVESNGIFYITDQNLRILKTEDNFVSNQENSMLLQGLDIVDKKYQIGDYIEQKNYVDVYSALFNCNRTLSEQQSLIKIINFKTVHDEYLNEDLLTCELTLHGGQNVEIINVNYGLKYKLNMFLSVYSQLYSLIGQKINPQNEQDNSVWTEEILDNCLIIVNNYYNYTQHGEDECYFNILPSGSNG